MHEDKGNALGVLTQRHGDRHQPTGYHSQQLDSVVKGLPPFMRALSTTALLCEAREELIMGSPLTTHVPHSVEMLLNSQYAQYHAVSQLSSYKVLLLSLPTITLAQCSYLNPATLLPATQE